MRKFFLAIVIGSSQLSAPSNGFASETVDVCTQVVTVINHPAQYMSERIKKGGIRCFLQPQCCTPLWLTNPVCYVYENKRIKEAFTETKNEMQCNTRAVADGVKEFVAKMTNPLFILSPQLFTAYRTYVDATGVVAKELPDDVKKMMQLLVGRGGIPFNHQQIERARWVGSDEPLGFGLLPPGDSYVAMVHKDLIVVAPAMQNATGCYKYALWAHELTHVFQNERDTAEGFTRGYVLQASQHPYEKRPYEIEAYAVENKVKADYCHLFGYHRQ